VLIRNASHILKAEAKQDAIVAMLLDRLWSISTLVINRSTSLKDLLEFIDVLGKPLRSTKLELRIIALEMGILSTTF
jgi:hypothetical protein